MKKIPIKSILILAFSIVQSCASFEPPKAIEPLPNEHQISWQEMEFYGFIR